MFVVGSSAVDAASGGRAARDPPRVREEVPDDIAKRGAEYLQNCMQDWDAATHMTKQEWSRTCQRVVKDRVQFLLEQAKQDGKPK
jgi:hypothetical protein